MSGPDQSFQGAGLPNVDGIDFDDPAAFEAVAPPDPAPANASSDESGGEVAAVASLPPTQTLVAWLVVIAMVTWLALAVRDPLGAAFASFATRGPLPLAIGVWLTGVFATFIALAGVLCVADLALELVGRMLGRPGLSPSTRIDGSRGR